MKLLRLYLLFVFIAPLTAHGESRNSGWLGTFAKREITENYYGWIETQLRYGFDQGGTNQILYRTGLLYRLNDSHELGFLYGYIESGNQKEHRFALQHVQRYGELVRLEKDFSNARPFLWLRSVSCRHANDSFSAHDAWPSPDVSCVP